MSHLDRTGEPVDDDTVQQPLHDPRCDGKGWIDRDADPAIPCLDCKPHLAKAALRAKTFGPYETRET